MSRFRAYFYDERGKELSESRFNGKEWCATGSGIKLRSGEYDKRGRTTVTVKTGDPKDVEHIYWNGHDKPPTGSIKGNYVVTMDDFPGHRKVGVKVWAPGGAIEKFWLISEDARRMLESKAANDFDAAKAKKAQLETAVREASEAMKNWPRNSMGLVTDVFKLSSAYKIGKARYDKAFSELQAFNAKYTKQFKTQLRDERRNKTIAGSKRINNETPQIQRIADEMDKLWKEIRALEKNKSSSNANASKLANLHDHFDKLMKQLADAKNAYYKITAAASIFPLKPGEEILIYGLPKGKTERYTENLLSSRCKTQADIDKVKEAAGKDGWHSFRVTKFKEGTRPDFTKTLAAKDIKVNPPKKKKWESKQPVTAMTAEEKRARYKELMQRFKELNHKSKLLLTQKLRAKDEAKREAVQKERDANDKALHDVLEEMRALTRRTKSTEAKLNAYANLVMAYDPNQPRDQEGSDRGQWVKRKGMSISGGEPTGGTAATYNAQEKRWEAKGISDVRIKSLGIPPAWQKVRINPDENADLQVLGLDAKGRTQYLYSEAFSKSQTAAKFERVIGLRQKIDDLEKATVKDIGAGNDTAAAVRLMHLTGMRPGSDADTGAEKKAHGATNLLKEHVKVSGDTIHYDFIGKKGINIKGAVKDKLLAKHISRRLATDDGVRLFKTDGGKVNDYIKAKAGSDYKVKDLRTLKATSMAASLIKSMERPKTVREFNAARNAIGDRVSAQLGNTRSMALKAYINPIVFKGWEPQQ